MAAGGSTGDSLLDALNASIYVSGAAFDLLQEAMHAKDTPALSPLISIHNRAIQMRFKAETAHWVELERRKVLVNAQELTDPCRRCLETVIRRLRKLAAESGPQCNPDDPIRAVTILERAVAEVIEAGRMVLNSAASAVIVTGGEAKVVVSVEVLQKRWVGRGRGG